MSVEWVLSSSGLVLLVLLVRFFFRKKIPSCLRYALWLVVALRLLFPVSISRSAVSILNLIPERKPIEESLENRAEQIAYEKTAGADTIPEEAGMVLQPKEPVSEKEMVMNMQDASAQGSGTKAGNGEINIGMALNLIWMLGTGVCGSIFLTVNLDYGRRLRRSRKRILPPDLPVMPEIPVYETQLAASPCLFGLLFPAVYMREEVVNEEKTLLFVLCHENAHYRQHDHWWSLVRIGCLCMHWFNPLVWLAFGLSRQDAELACDEKTLKILGDKARADYGKVLLELSTQKGDGFSSLRIATSMSGSARQMKERLLMIIKAPGRTIVMQILVMILVMFLSVITFTGKSRAQEIEDQNAGDGNGETENIKPDEMPDQHWDTADGEKTPAVYSESGEEDALTADLNFDGWDDLCFHGRYTDEVNTPYYCMLWNPEKNQYEYSAMLYNVEVDEEQQWISERTSDESGQYQTTYYRYDENNQLHMVRYLEENSSPDALFERLDLTYVEDDSPYMLPAIVDGKNFHHTLLAMAKQSLTELYQWTGEKVDTACFQVSDMGDVYFGLTPEDIRHSRIFYSRAFGADTEYNLSNYEKSISSMYVTSGRSVWYSPVLWRVFPERMDEMTEEEIIIWYLERIPLVKDCKVKSIEKRYEDMWTIQTKDGVWFEVVYDVQLKEIGIVSGPYPEYPVH